MHNKVMNVRALCALDLATLGLLWQRWAMNRSLPLVFFISVLTGCANYAGKSIEVSVGRLAAQPSKFEGAVVTVPGYFRESLGWLVLYSSEELAAINGAPKLYVHRPPDSERLDVCLNGWVKVVGEYGVIPSFLHGIVRVERILAYDIGEPGAVVRQCW